MTDTMKEATLQSSASVLGAGAAQKKFLNLGLLGSITTSIGYFAALAYYVMALPLGYFVVRGYIFHFSFVYGLSIPFAAPLLAAGYYGLSKKQGGDFLRIAAGIMVLVFVLSVFGTTGLIVWFNVPVFALWHFFVLAIVTGNSFLIGAGFHMIQEQLFSPGTVRTYVLLLIGWNTYFIIGLFFNFGSLSNPLLILSVVTHHSVNILLGILAAYIFHGESRAPSSDD